MKVLIFMTQFYQLSGAERLAVELAVSLNKQGIYTDILSQYTDILPGVSGAKAALIKNGIPSVHFLGLQIHPSIRSLLPAFFNLKRLIKQQKYDIIETSMVLPGVLATWATLGTQVKHITGLHQVFRKDRENLVLHKFWRFSIRCNRNIRYYAISDFVAAQWIIYSNTSPKYTRRIYNGIPDDCFNATPDRSGMRKEFLIPENCRVAIYVGRLAAYKGIDTIVDALGPILEQHNLYLFFVGAPDLSVNGTKIMLEKIEEKLDRENWRNHVRFLGKRMDVPRLMASSDMLVHPTRTEGFGLVLVEAMATGLPVIASNVEGIPEVLSDTDSFMIPPDNPMALQKSVLSLLGRSEDAAMQAARRGRMRAEMFRSERRTSAILEFFNDVLKNRI